MGIKTAGMRGLPKMKPEISPEMKPVVFIRAEQDNFFYP
jgi:hypothetical protein